MKIYYTVNEEEFDDYFELEVSGADPLYSIAEDCAEDYMSNSNWENEESNKFFIWNENKELLGSYTVYIEYSPNFYAVKDVG